MESQDLKVFRQRHAKDCIVRWPNQPPTNGIEAHEQEALAFFKMLPDQHLVNNPYEVMFAQNKHCCRVYWTDEGSDEFGEGCNAHEQKLQGRFLHSGALERRWRDP